MTPTWQDIGTEGRFYARSASDRTDDWPYWYVADREKAGLNVTVALVPEMRGCMPFLSRKEAESLAQAANRPSPPSKEGE